MRSLSVPPLLFVLFCCRTINGFAPKIADSTKTCTQLNVWFPDEGMDVARKTFGWWIMGAAGSGGAARSAFPQIYKEYMELQQLKGQGPTLGGPTIGIGPLLGFPEDVCVKDIEQIVNNPLTVEQITQQFPVENNFLADKGYLTYSAFKRANADANPLAVRAVFDSFRKPKSVEPYLAQELIDEYKRDPTLIRQNLVIKQGTLIMAAGTLLFLLGLADVASATDFYRGWFPSWPGGQNFPFSVFTKEGSIFTIPDYFLWDIPPDRF